MSGAGAEASNQPASGASRAAFGFIFVTVLLDMMALGVTIPVLPKLVESFLNNDTAAAARWFGLFGTIWALMQFFFSPLLGALSDRFGRRPVVLLSNFGLAFDYVLMALAPTLGEARSRLRADRRSLRRRLHPGTRGRRAAGWS
jgi:DHA1 family tetracycline resistance protein-like MFS transporter